MPRLRRAAASDLCQTYIENVGNLSLKGLSQFVQVGPQRRHFLWRKMVYRCGIHAALDDTLRDFFGFFAECRYFVGGRRNKVCRQAYEKLVDHHEHRDNFRHSLGTIESH
jgi:hypothetical protein